ncbi:uncharacterized protein LAESUDRAFT_730971 [Laetiporus sulphureus 93-53]|uniref:Uncharacterized protein n=1 Tax=Laetiporus sulphureus 93-53 TaxID=1314785 RepID=A0A165BUT5_9APHY|nr:uncharacterized protein LAESUDRAFT_730971 [Laetiporus sulphureus 93-53]KZT01695.1 hypothetical protein LAESUDRAFT_730971 [Laetiporus sulphureus 93-53]
MREAGKLSSSTRRYLFVSALFEVHPLHRVISSADYMHDPSRLYPYQISLDIRT